MNFPTSHFPHPFPLPFGFFCGGRLLMSLRLICLCCCRSLTSSCDFTLVLLWVSCLLLFLSKQLVIYFISCPCIIIVVYFCGHQYYSPFIWFIQDQELKEGEMEKQCSWIICPFLCLLWYRRHRMIQQFSLANLFLLVFFRHVNIICIVWNSVKIVLPCASYL